MEATTGALAALVGVSVASSSPSGPSTAISTSCCNESRPDQLAEGASLFGRACFSGLLVKETREADFGSFRLREGETISTSKGTLALVGEEEGSGERRRSIMSGLEGCGSTAGALTLCAASGPALPFKDDGGSCELCKACCTVSDKKVEALNSAPVVGVTVACDRAVSDMLGQLRRDAKVPVFPIVLEGELGAA